MAWARISEYSGTFASSSSWVPSAMTRPSSSSSTRLARAIVEMRWAMTMVVRWVEQAAQCFVDPRFDVDVDGARRVVENQDRRVEQQRARDGDALTLTARERVAALADDGVVALGQAHDELVRVGRAGRGLDSSNRGVGSAVGDVVADRDRKEERLVEDDADVRAKRAERHVADVVAVDLDGAGGDVIEARQQPRDGRLARPGAPDERDGLAGRDVGVKVAEDLGAVVVREGHVVEVDRAPDVEEVVGAGTVDDLGILVEDLEDAARAGLRPLSHHHELAEHHEGRLEHQEVEAEGEDLRDSRSPCSTIHPPHSRTRARPSWGKF